MPRRKPDQTHEAQTIFVRNVRSDLWLDLALYARRNRVTLGQALNRAVGQFLTAEADPARGPLPSSQPQPRR